MFEKISVLHLEKIDLCVSDVSDVLLKKINGKMMLSFTAELFRFVSAEKID